FDQPEVKFEDEPEKTADDFASEEINIEEKDFKIPAELQNSIDSALAEMDEDFINNIENEFGAKLENSEFETKETADENEFALDEKAFAESLKEQNLTADSEDDIVFNIDDFEFPEEKKENIIPEPILEIKEGNSESIDEIKEEPEEFSGQPYQAGAYKKPEPETEDIQEEINSINEIEIKEEFTGEMSKEDEEFFANLSKSENDELIFSGTNDDSIQPNIEEEIKKEDSFPNFDDFPPGLLDDDGIPKPEGEIPDDFNFDIENESPIEPEKNQNMFEEETVIYESPIQQNDFSQSIIEDDLHSDSEINNYNFDDDTIKILEGELTDEQNLDEKINTANKQEINLDEKFLSDEELEADENLRRLQAEKESEKEIINESSTEDGHMTADQLMMINKAAQLVNSNIKLDDVLSNIVDVATNLTNADRGTLYLVDKEKNELWSKVAMGNELKQIRLTIGEGIAGWVAKSGEIVNIQDVKSDSRFKADYDKSSGYQTKTMLCFPIKNKEEEIVGVVQLLNSKNGKFSALDETFLSALSIHAALALENANLVEKLLQTERV
ncbi:MAG: GAF domain-containing protein, partial [Melioribacteraceae bacterium]